MRHSRLAPNLLRSRSRPRHQPNRPPKPRPKSFLATHEECTVHVLLTGGYGCIGSWIVRNLLERGDAIWIYDLKEDLHRLRLILEDDQINKVRFAQGDVTDLGGLREVIRANRITHVIHLAGLQVPVCRADPIL